MNNTTDIPGTGKSERAINIPGIISIFVFYVIILVIGLVASWKTKSYKKSGTVDVFLAGRNIGAFVGIFTMTATWVGGGYINGTAEVVFDPDLGLVWAQAPLGFSVSLVLGGLFYAGRMREAGYVTMLDPIEKRYGRIMSGMCYLPALSGEIFWSGAILSALGASLAVILNLSHDLSIIISAAIAVLYTLLGGLYSVAYTDIVQLICIFIGLWISVPFAMTHPAVSSVSSTSARWLGSLAAGPGVLSYIDSYLLIIMGGIPWQVYFQRVLAAKDSRTAKLLSYIAGVGCVIMAVPAALIGTIAASTEWNATDYGQAVVPKEEYGLILPMVLQFLCPTAVSFVGLGAVSAAVMSSADSSIFSASSMFAKNIYKPLREAVCGPCKKWEVTWVMRLVVILAAAGAVAMAITVKSVYGLFMLCADFVYVILFPQLTCALFVPHTNVIGSAVSYALGLFFRLSGGDSILGIPVLIKYPWYDEANNVQLFPFRTMSMVIGLLVNLIISIPARGILKSKVNDDNDLPVRQSTQERNGTDNKGYTDGDKRENMPL